MGPGGPTLSETVMAEARSVSSQTMRWRASAVRGAAEEYLSGLRAKTRGTDLPVRIGLGRQIRRPRWGR
jgi:hypothetical protein